MKPAKNSSARNASPYAARGQIDPYAGSSSSSLYGSSSSGNPYGSSSSGSSYSSGSSSSLYGSGSSGDPYGSGSPYGRSPSPSPRPAPRPPRRSGPNWLLILLILVLLAAVGVGLFLLLGGSGSENGALPTATPVQKEAEVAQATATPKSTATPGPTNTPTSKPTATPGPTNTPTPKPTETPGPTNTPTPTSKPMQTAKLPQAELFQLYDPSMRWFMNQLSEKELSLFSILYDAVATQQETATVPPDIYPEELLDRVLRVLRDDCPELIHFEGDITYSTRGDYITSVTFTYTYDTYEKTKQVLDQIRQELDKILSAQQRAEDDLHKEYAIYRNIVQRAYYDKDVEYCSKADSVFVYGRAKCAGYAAALDLACRYYGIPSICVEGMGENEPHAWNYVQIDGEWYACDSTWDRSIYESYKDTPAPLNENLYYFNLTEKQMEKDHSLDPLYKEEKWKLPSCTATAAAFNENFLPVTVVDKDWESVLVDQLNEVVNGKRSYIAIRCTKEKLYDDLKNGYRSRIKQWSSTTGYGPSYITMLSDEFCTLWLYDFQISASNLYREDNLWVRFFDVGDADAAIVYCEGSYMLIDGGTEKSGSSLLYTFLRDNGITYVDAVIASHPHSDHCGGLCGALSYEGCEFGTLYSPVLSSDNESFNKLLDIATRRGLRPVVPSVGMMFQLGSANVRFLSPDAYRSYEDMNNKSLVIRIDYGSTSFMFTGDAMENAEEDMLNSMQMLDADVLKVAHHGAATSTTQAFLDAVDPYVAIISCGPNSTTHPSEEVLNRLKGIGASVYRTDIHGDIVIFSDGTGISSLTQK